MSDQSLELVNGDGQVTIELQGFAARARLGSTGADGSVVVTDSADRISIQLDGGDGRITVGGPGVFGQLDLRNRDGSDRIGLNGQSGRVTGETGRFRQVHAIDEGGAVRIAINGPEGVVQIGFDTVAGRVELRSGTSGTASSIVLDGRIGDEATADIGGGGVHGRLRVRNADDEVTMEINGESGNAAIGGSRRAGRIFVKAGPGSSADNTFELNGATGSMAVGAEQRPGQISLCDELGKETILLRGTTGNLAVGRFGKDGNIFVKNALGQNVIHLSGETGNVNVDGDVRLSGGDLAERFTVAATGTVSPGDVVALTDEGTVAVAVEAYDRRVVGVVSGAGNLKPGLILAAAEPDSATLALSGRVYCKVDAGSAPIQVGDLLTSSPVPGHAMKATDPTMAFGAVLGKAAGTVAHGRGLIPVIVCLL